MKDREIVSVFIIGNNNECKLEKAFNSLLSQTNSNFEIIFKDNCSDDHSYECAISYSEKFKEKGIYMSVSSNRFKMSDDDCFNGMVIDSEGLLLYFMNPVVAVDEQFIEHTKTLFGTNRAKAIILSKDLASGIGNGEVDNAKLWKAIFQYPLSYNEMVFNRNASVIYNRNLESFVGYQHIYRIFLYSLIGAVLVDDATAISENMDSDNVNEENMLDVFEKYRFYIAMGRKAAVFDKQCSLPEKDYVKRVLKSDCEVKADKLRAKNKKDEALRYEYLSKVFDLI